MDSFDLVKNFVPEPQNLVYLDKGFYFIEGEYSYHKHQYFPNLLVFGYRNAEFIASFFRKIMEV
ncbi:hypothetical protein SpAn4DRAFT_0180 [Sporomusa ovata]|uniref:Uncharacterized protein n=1 Tax=Sporomusa ovata TaxID=2378 RepID=A0A0U1L211_9FIRM|nr:hypothetical protein SOV_5c03110 [Sporomusa ovata DSM 2662]CQR73718.1 hypothetical protein SpAn4DRAFT_0180 [Sporomusa ovata]